MKHLTAMATFLVLLSGAFAEDEPKPTANGDATRRISVLIRSEQFAQAETLLLEQLNQEPDNLGAHFLYATLLIKVNRYPEARVIFERLIAARPDDYRVLNNYAWFLATAIDRNYRDPPRALAMAQDAILMAPAVHNVWNTLGEAHYSNGNFDRAVRIIKTAIEAARSGNAPRSTLQSYQQQLRRMQEAAAIMSLVE